jgi:hypothetical protein
VEFNRQQVLTSLDIRKKKKYNTGMKAILKFIIRNVFMAALKGHLTLA